MKYLALVWATWIAWIPITFWLGRVFCRYICPLGLSQTIVHRIFRPRAHVRRVCTRLPRPALQRCVNLACLLLYFTLPVGALLHPWGIFGRVLVLFIPGIVFFAAILVLAVFAKGRVWCNWICPLGTMFDFVARFGWHQDKIGKGCANCRACFPKPPKGKPAAESANVGRREVLLGTAALAAVELAEKTTDGGYAPVSFAQRPSNVRPVLPPGAANDFSLLCVGCGICTRACPEKILRPSLAFPTFGHPRMDFTAGACRLACPQKCAQECPVGALRVLNGAKRKDIHMGCARWREDRCIRTTQGIACTACSRKCPVDAIKIVAGFPVVDEALCVGCGACEHVCPARPAPALVVEGFERQRIVRPRADAVNASLPRNRA